MKATSTGGAGKSGSAGGPRLRRRDAVVGTRLWASPDDAFAIHGVRRTDGTAVYQGRKCGRIAGIPVALTINRKYAVLECRLARCGASGTLEDQILPAFYRVFVGRGIRDDCEGQRAILESGRHCWPAGHALFLEVARLGLCIREPLWDKTLTKQVFGEGYYAHSITWSDALRLAYASIESQWDAEGRIRLPDYFTVFGVIDAKRRHDELSSIADREAQQGKRRRLTNREAQAVRLLERITSELMPEMRIFFGRYRYSYRVIETRVLGGCFSRGRRRREVRIELTAGVFAQDLGTSLATFLHEHSSLFGGEGSGAFADALTTMLEQVIRRREQLEGYQSRWRDVRESIVSERSARGSSHVNSLARQQTSSQEAECCAPAARLPNDVRQSLADDWEAGEQRR
ncbi:MAG: hypothetical protein JXQ75_04545 [Phycisphaerae bacterium]|nr:hypothetical protein [Phycisphaerae bacterium]